MSGVNKVILVGHLGRDPEIRTFPNGDRVANLSLATSETWRDKATGERKERTEWHRVVILNQSLVGVAERFLKKGSKLYVEGQLATRKFEKDGRDAFVTEIVLRPYNGDLKLLDKTEGGVPRGDADDYNRADAPRPGNATTSSQDMDDEIPF